MIWKKEPSIIELNSMPNNHVGGLLEIEFIDYGEDFLVAKMPVNEKTKQPFGILHGGSSVVLAETLGSMASVMCIDMDKYIAVGLEVNANHLRPVSSGFVKGVCTAIHIGAKTHVWDIKIYTDRGKLSCVSRLTVAIVPNKK